MSADAALGGRRRPTRTRRPRAAALVVVAAACGGGGDGSGGASATRGADNLACLASSSCRRTAGVSDRGVLYYAPENTVAAVDVALRQGGEWVSVDVRRTADGAAVLMHDPDIDRVTTGRGLVAGYALADLSPFPVLPPDQRGGLGSPELLFLAATGRRVLVNDPKPIPTLEQVVTELGGRAALALQLFVEDDGVGAVVRRVDALGALDRVLFVAYSPAHARLVRQASGAARYAVRPEDFAEWQAFTGPLAANDFVAVQMGSEDPGFGDVAAAARGRGRKLIVETLGTTDSLATTTETVALQGGASPTEVLAAARFPYQQLFERVGPDLVLTNRIEIVADFARDWNLAQGF